MTGHLFEMEFKSLKSKQVKSLMGSLITKEQRLLHKIATEIEEIIIKEAKLYFLKLALGEANFVDRCPRLSNTARELMYTRTGRRSGVMPRVMLP